MSALIALKADGAVILASDSRCYSDGGKCFESDAEPKIFQVTPGLFFGYCGYVSLSDAQVRTAQTLSQTEVTRNLGMLADQLDAESMPELERLANALAEKYPESETQFHSYALCGASEGELGFLTREFHAKNGKVWREDSDCFHITSAGWISPGKLVTDIVNDPEIWADGIIPAAERLVDHLRRVTPFVGGPIQMACIDKLGPRWIHRPPHALTDNVIGKVAHESR